MRAARVDTLTELFRALADPARLEILHLLARAETDVCVCDLTAALSLSQPTVSHHLARLRKAGLISGERRGVWSHWRLRPDLDDAARVALALVA
jgi:ArsR family transcriptional regulator